MQAEQAQVQTLSALLPLVYGLEHGFGELQGLLEEVSERPMNLELSKRTLAFAKRAEQQAELEQTRRAEWSAQAVWIVCADGDRRDEVERRLRQEFVEETGRHLRDVLVEIEHVKTREPDMTVLRVRGKSAADFFHRRGWRIITPVRGDDDKITLGVVNWARGILASQSLSRPGLSVRSRHVPSSGHAEIDYLLKDGKILRLAVSAGLRGYRPVPMAEYFNGPEAHVIRATAAWLRKTRPRRD